MKTYRIRIEGKTPLLMHSDNIEWSDQMESWKNDPRNKNKSKPGDDRTPPWRWIGCLYHDGRVVTIPAENIMRSIMEAATEVPTGKGRKTFKAQSQSGIISSEFHWPLLIDGKEIAWKDIDALKDLEAFQEHCQAVKMLGFSLYPKRGRIGNRKHIRVRPRFDLWSIEGDLIVTDEQITKEILGDILEIAGRLKGLCDWRPGSKTPGSWGMFTAKID